MTVIYDVSYVSDDVFHTVYYIFLFVIIILLTSSIKADSYLKSLQFVH